MSDAVQLRERMDWWDHPDRASMRHDVNWSCVYRHIQHALSLAINTDLPATAHCARTERTALIVPIVQRGDFCQAGVVAPPDSPDFGNLPVSSLMNIRV
jgi:hypothetical protein